MDDLRDILKSLADPLIPDDQKELAERLIDVVCLSLEETGGSEAVMMTVQGEVDRAL